MKKLICLFSLLAVTCFATPTVITIGGISVTISPISDYPRDRSPTNGVLFVFSHPGDTNYNISFVELITAICTNPVTASLLTQQGIIVTNISTNIVVTTQISNIVTTLTTNLMQSYQKTLIGNSPVVTGFFLDFSLAQNFDIFMSNSTVPLSLILTNLVITTNQCAKARVQVYNIGTNAATVTFNTNFVWVTQLTNTSVNAWTNIPAGARAMYDFTVTQTSFSTNTAFQIISYNP